MTVEYTPTESTVAGTIWYIANHLAYKPRHDLGIHGANVCPFTAKVYPILNQDKFSKYYLTAL